MPWCPKCKNEYVAGVTTCADCGCELVETLSEEKVSIYFGKEEELLVPLSFLKKNGIESAEIIKAEDAAEADAETEIFELFVAESDVDKAKKVMRAVLQAANDLSAEMVEQPDESDEAKEQDDNPNEYVGVYKNSEQKAAEFKDSAYTLIGVGGIGLVAIILLACGVLPFRIPFASPYLMYGVMGTMFLIFIIVGVRSMQSAKIYKKQALSESNLKDEIMKWCQDNLSAERIDFLVLDKIKQESGEEIDIERIMEEEKYFKRSQVIRDQVVHNFMNIDEAFLDNLIDEFYSTVFGE